jgi:hypothetical protein
VRGARVQGYNAGMRALVYDRTQGQLTRIWGAGSVLYRGLRRLDAVRGVTSWDEALAWLGSQTEPIDEIQYWGHGHWGRAYVHTDVLEARSLVQRAKQMAAIRERLSPNALLWFRTCETLGAHLGQDFAQRLSDYFGARVAGHTHIIGFHQSGLHGLHPGERPHWSAEEGLHAGTAAAPQQALHSAPWRTRTITCLGGKVPEAWFSSAATDQLSSQAP